jgi:hypothetical protein
MELVFALRLEPHPFSAKECIKKKHKQSEGALAFHCQVYKKGAKEITVYIPTNSIEPQILIEE